MTSWLGSIAVALHLWHPAAACAAFSPGGELPTIVADEWQENTTSLCNDGYAVLASGITHGPLWSAEHVTRAALAELPFTPRMGAFNPDYRLPAAQRSTLADYIGSGYDRGHMTPSGDAADPSLQEDTFLLSGVRT